MTEEQTAPSYEYNLTLENLVGYQYDSAYYRFSPDKVKQWLQDPMRHNKNIRKLSRYLYNACGAYKRSIDFMVSMPTLNRVVVPLNKDQNKFKKKSKIFYQTLKQIKDKALIRDILFTSSIEGIYYGYFVVNQSEDLPTFLDDQQIDEIVELNARQKCSVLPLPIDWCRIIGIKNSVYVVAFNLEYFDQFRANGLSLKLRKYPKEIRESYKEFKTNRKEKWVTLDPNKTIVRKSGAKISEPFGRPKAMGAFLSLLYDDYFAETKRNVLSRVNNMIIYQTFPEGEKGQSSLRADQQKAQHNNIKSALFQQNVTQGITFFSLAAGTKLDKISVDLELLKTETEDSLLKKVSTDLGFASSLLNGESGNYASQQSNLDMLSRELQADIEAIQDEINKVINENIMKDYSCEVRYLPTIMADRDKYAANMQNLYTQGKGSLIAWIAASGWNPEDYLALMDYEASEKFDEKYLPHPTSFTLTGDNDGGGRPREDDPDNNNTGRSKTHGNKQPRPSS